MLDVLSPYLACYPSGDKGSNVPMYDWVLPEIQHMKAAIYLEISDDGVHAGDVVGSSLPKPQPRGKGVLTGKKVANSFNAMLPPGLARSISPAQKRGGEAVDVTMRSRFSDGMDRLHSLRGCGVRCVQTYGRNTIRSERTPPYRRPPSKQM